MLEGTLTVNLDPPYLHFTADGNEKGYSSHFECSEEEVLRILTELGSEIFEGTRYKECIVRTTGSFPKALLSQFHLLPPATRQTSD